MRDHFVARPDAQRHERHPDRIGSVAESNGIFGAVIFRQLAFKFFEHGPHHILAAFQDFFDICVNF